MPFVYNMPFFSILICMVGGIVTPFFRNRRLTQIVNTCITVSYTHLAQPEKFEIVGINDPFINLDYMVYMAVSYTHLLRNTENTE